MSRSEEYFSWMGDRIAGGAPLSDAQRSERERQRYEQMLRTHERQVAEAVGRHERYLLLRQAFTAFAVALPALIIGGNLIAQAGSDRWANVCFAFSGITGTVLFIASFALAMYSLDNEWWDIPKERRDAEQAYADFVIGEAGL